MYILLFSLIILLLVLGSMQKELFTYSNSQVETIQHMIPHLPTELVTKNMMPSGSCEKNAPKEPLDTSLKTQQNGYNYYTYLNDGSCSTNTPNIDPNTFYASKLQIVKTILEDPMTRGYNFTQYNTVGSIKDIGRIPLNATDTSYARPSNYIFVNSPTYKR